MGIDQVKDSAAGLSLVLGTAQGLILLSRG